MHTVYVRAGKIWICTVQVRIYYLYLRPEVQSRTGRVMIHDKFIQ
jgi:hypothetical protein